MRNTVMWLALVLVMVTSVSAIDIDNMNISGENRTTDWSVSYDLVNITGDQYNRTWFETSDSSQEAILVAPLWTGANDYSGNNHSAWVGGGTVFNESLRAYEFNSSTGAYVQFNGLGDYDMGEWTAHVKVEFFDCAIGTIQELFVMDGGSHTEEIKLWQRSGDNRITFESDWGVSYIGGNLCEANTPMWMTISMDGGVSAKIYKNGVLDAEDTTIGDPTGTAFSRVRLAERPANSDEELFGRVYEYHLFNWQQTDEQVANFIANDGVLDASEVNGEDWNATVLALDNDTQDMQTLMFDTGVAPTSITLNSVTVSADGSEDSDSNWTVSADYAVEGENITSTEKYYFTKDRLDYGENVSPTLSSSQTAGGEYWFGKVVIETSDGKSEELGTRFYVKKDPYNSDHLGIANSEDIIFVDKHNPGCDNSHDRITAMDGDTPWCSLGNFIADKAQAGDTIYILGGNYEYPNQELIWYGVNFNPRITISGYPGENVTMGNYDTDFLTVPNNLWERVEGASNNQWQTTASVYNDESCTMAYWETGELLMSLEYSSKLGNVGSGSYEAPEGFYCWGNGQVKVAFDDPDADPNKIPLYFAGSKFRFLNPHTSTGINLHNFTVKYSTIGIDLKNAGETEIRGVNITGAVRNGIYVSGESGHANKRNIVIRDSYFDKKHPDDWAWEATKGSREEATAIQLSNAVENITIVNNTIVNWFNGIIIDTNSLSNNKNTVVANNTIHSIYDDGIEFEPKCTSAKVYNNVVYDAFVAMSLSTFQSDDTCQVYNNILDGSRGIIGHDSNLNWDGEAYKIIWPTTEGIIQNAEFVHNTGLGGSGIYSNGDKTNTQVNTSWVNNIFWTNDEEAVHKSGNAASGAFYDYNLYWTNSSASVFRFWYDDSDGTSYSTLSDALAAINNTYKWDLNSLNVDPELSLSYFYHDGSRFRINLTDVTPEQVIAQYTPQEFSPVIDAGLDNYSYRKTDFYGNPIYGQPDMGAIEWQPPYTMSEDMVTIGETVVVYDDGKFKYQNSYNTDSQVLLGASPQEGFSEMANNVPRSEWMNLTPYEANSTYVRWNASSDASEGVMFTVGNLTANAVYTVSIDSVENTTFVTDGSGVGEFTYTGGFSEHEFEVSQTDESVPTYSNVSVSPSSPQDYDQNQDYTFSITWNDLDEDFSASTLTFSGTDYNMSGSGNGEYTHTLTGVSAGNHTYTFTGEDAAGNSVTTPQYTYEVRSVSNDEDDDDNNNGGGGGGGYIPPVDDDVVNDTTNQTTNTTDTDSDNDTEEEDTPQKTLKKLQDFFGVSEDEDTEEDSDESTTVNDVVKTVVRYLLALVMALVDLVL